MAKTITFSYKDKDYTLEYTRSAVATMERQGFVAADIDIKPMLTLPALFAGAFLAHHSSVKREVIDEIYKKLPNKREFLAKLGEMYAEPIESLTAEPEEGEGNIAWGSSF